MAGTGTGTGTGTERGAEMVDAVGCDEDTRARVETARYSASGMRWICNTGMQETRPDVGSVELGVAGYMGHL